MTIALGFLFILAVFVIATILAVAMIEAAMWWSDRQDLKDLEERLKDGAKR